MQMFLSSLLSVLDEKVEFELFCEETFEKLDYCARFDNDVLNSEVYHINSVNNKLKIYVHLPNDY